ncbi:MAG: EAL domain-containing protein [Acidimicrobiales bacterium]|jgi:diguanylate cyclase (GGDEF)-like protein
MSEPLFRGPDRKSLRRGFWIAIAVVVVALGSLGAFLGAGNLSNSDVQQAHANLQTSTAEIASALNLAIEHEQDLAISAGAYIVENPNASESSFLRWVKNVDAFQRYPEILAVAEVEIVHPSQLKAFAARAAINEIQSRAPSQTFTLTPPGKRPFYCLVDVEHARTGLPEIPIGLDMCDSSLGPQLLQARDSGQPTYAPDSLGGPTAFAVGTPLYRNGSHPSTLAARRADLIGFTGTEILPKTILTTALLGHPGDAVAFEYKRSGSDASFKAGHRPTNAISASVGLHNGWHVQVFAAAVAGGVFGQDDSILLFLGGALLSLLLGLLIYVLGTSRSSAMQLVKERTDQLQHQALHDSLTGLPNRALILDRIDRMLSRSRREHTEVAALFLDLDNFKDINDTLGHRAGDELLVSVGVRLQSAVRENDTVGRLGGDEFVVLADGVSLDAGVDVVADRLLDVMATPFIISASRVPLNVSASIGIAEGDRLTPEALLQDADIALYQAKAAGKQRAVKFIPSMQESVDHHRRLEVDLQGALEKGQFFLMYQPTVDLATGGFTGVEALIRWNHPERGIVQPNDFIPALESSGLIIPVGAWVLHEACRQGALWQGRGHRFTVSVNISAKQLERDQLVTDVREAITISGFDADELILELTETALMHDSGSTLSRLMLLKALGVRVAIDDFGTGYSSLAYLRQFPIDILKIDRTFVSGIADSRESAALVHTLVQLGKVLGIETIAEGVETSDQRTRLETERVDTGQGFLFARPLAVEDLDRLLLDSAGKPEWLSVALPGDDT